MHVLNIEYWCTLFFARGICEKGLFALETQQNEIPKNAINNGTWGWAPTRLGIKVHKSFQTRHNAQFTILVAFLFCSSNRFKYHQNACFRDIVFKKILCNSKSSQILSECMQFHIALNATRMHTLETLSLVAIHHVLLIWSFDDCVLLLDHYFRQARTWWCSVTHTDSRVHAIFLKMWSSWLCLFFVNIQHDWTKTMLLKLGKTSQGFVFLWLLQCCKMRHLTNVFNDFSTRLQLLKMPIFIHLFFTRYLESLIYIQ